MDRGAAGEFRPGVPRWETRSTNEAASAHRRVPDERTRIADRAHERRRDHAASEADTRSQASYSPLRERYATALVVVAGMACVMGVLTSMLSVTAGLARAYCRPEDATRAMMWSGRATFDQH